MKLTRFFAACFAAILASATLHAQENDELAFRHYEAIIRNQTIQLERFSKSNPFTVGTIMDLLREDGGAAVVNMTVEAIHNEGEDLSVISDPKKILAFDIVDAMLLKDENGKYTEQKGRENLTLTINVSDYFSYVVHVRCHEYQDAVSYYRVSLITYDDEEAFPASFMIAYDHEDNTQKFADLDVYDAAAREAYKNDTEDLEQFHYVNSCYESYPVFVYKHTGLSHLENSEWFDAYTDFSRILTFTRDSASIYRPMMEALEHLDNPVEKNYFEGLAAWSEGSDYSEDGFLTELTAPSDDVTVGFALETLFNVKKKFVTGLSIMQKKGKKYVSSTENDQDKIWKMKLEDLCGEDVTASFRYSRLNSDFKDEPDSSNSCWGGAIVLRSEAVTKDAKVVSMMIPNFIGDDDKHDYTTKRNDPIFNTFIMQKGKASSLDVINGSLAKIVNDVNNKTVSAETLNECYYVGYCLNELGLYNKSIPFLNIARYTRTEDCIIEYINGLVNCNDPRALDSINAYLTVLEQQDPEGTTLMNLRRFLNRRKAYTLIELERYDEAKEVLRYLLWDPETKEYAEGELEYIKSIENR